MEVATVATDLATAYVQLVPSAKGIKSSIEKELGDAGTSAGQSAGSKIGSTIKKAIAAAGIGAVIKSAFSEGMELEQNLGGTEAVFGEFADSIQSNAAEAYKNMGMSASEYMATANKMGALFQGSGLDQQRSLDLTAQAMQRAADVASVMGLDTTAAMESIAGAAKGNFTMMDNLGVAMNATTLQAYALEKGINFDWNTADNATKAELAMQMFFDRTEQYAGNFARESSETLSGSLGAVKSAFKDVLGNLTLGADMTPSLEALKNTVITFVSGNFMPALVNIISTGLPVLVEMVVALGPPLVNAGIQAISSLCTGLASALPTLIPMAAQAITSVVTGLLDNIPALIEAALALVTGLADGILAAIPVLIDAIPQIITSLITAVLDSIPLIIQAGIDLLTSLVTALPEIIQAIVDAIPLIIDGVVTAVIGSIPQIIDAGIQLLVSLIQALPQIIAAIVPAIPRIVSSLVNAIINNIPMIIQAGVDLLVSLVSNLPQIISELVRAMPEIIQALVGALGQGVARFVEIGGDLVKGLWQGIQNFGGWLWDQVTGFFGGIWNGICGIFGINSPSKKMAWVGEMMDRGAGQGIDKYAYVAVNATKDMARQISDVGFGVDTSGIRGAVSAITRDAAGVVRSDVAIAARGGAQPGESADVLTQILQALLALSDKIDRLQIVLNTGALVGNLLDPLNEAMGVKNAMGARGAA